MQQKQHTLVVVVHLKPTSRLNRINEGLILFTNDRSYGCEIELPWNALYRTYHLCVHEVGEAGV